MSSAAEMLSAQLTAAHRQIEAQAAVIAAAREVVREYLDDDGSDLAFGVAFQHLLDRLAQLDGVTP